jgi:hypothetical protein
MYNTNPIQVLQANLPVYGFVNRYRLAEPVKIVITGGGKLYDVYEEQLVKRAPDGAWFIVETARHTPVPAGTPTAPPTTQLKLGVVHHTSTATIAIQKSIDAGRPADLYYLNPIKVMDHNLGQYGFTTPAQVVLPLRIVVNYGGRQYDVLLTQPAVRGEKGIWVISSIQRHQG